MITDLKDSTGNCDVSYFIHTFMYLIVVIQLNLRGLIVLIQLDLWGLVALILLSLLQSRFLLHKCNSMHAANVLHVTQYIREFKVYLRYIVMSHSSGSE